MCHAALSKFPCANEIHESSQIPKPWLCHWLDIYNGDVEAPLELRDAGDLLTEVEKTQLAHRPQQRHIQMMAIAGVIGPGLFLELGSSI